MRPAGDAHVKSASRMIQELRKCELFEVVTATLILKSGQIATSYETSIGKP